MQGDDKLSARSSIQRLRLPRPAAWAALSVFFLVLALGVFILRAQSTVSAQEPSTGLGVLRGLLGTQSSLLLVLSTAFVIFALWAFRRFRFAQLARRPGPIEIIQFVEIKDAAVPVENVVAHFRRTLRDVSLSPPMSMPGEPVSQDFLHVLRTATSQATGTIGAVVGMLSTLQVNSSYRVSGVLRKRDNNPRYGLTVQVVELPKNTGSVKTFWADNWFEAAELGAHFVGVYVLPRSRICARPPWTAWRGLPIPHELFHCYQVAQSMLRKERYEEALEALYAALRKDPQNPYIRIQVAQLREQLGQHLDAVTDYVDIIEIQAWQDRRLWKKLRQADRISESIHQSKIVRARGKLSKRSNEESLPPVVHLRAHRDGPEALLVARYRLVSALMRASRLARQWREHDIFDNPHRIAERRILRDRVQKWLTPRYAEFREICVGETQEPRLPDSLHKFLEEFPNLLPLLFQFVALKETTDLIKDYAWLRGRRRPNMSIPQSALRVLGVWAALHLILVELRISETAEAAAMRCVDKRVTRIRKRLRLTGEYSSWPSDPESVEALLNKALRWKPKMLQGWQEHYNSASVFAVILLHDKIDLKSFDQIAIKAVRCLERAVLTTGSGLSSRYHKWLSFGDQDLNGLRETDYFFDFTNRYFPRPEFRKEILPKELLERALWMHITGLIRRYAVLRADFWKNRAQRTADSLAVDEARREEDATLIVGDYIKDYWSWQMRLRLVKEAQRFAERLGDAFSFDSSFPSVDTILGAQAENMDRLSREVLRPLASDGRNAGLKESKFFPSEQAQVIDTGAPKISDPHHHEAHRTDREMKRLSGLWRTVDDVLDAALSRDPHATRKLATTLRRVASTAKRVGRPGGEPPESLEPPEPLELPVVTATTPPVTATSAQR